MKTDLKTRGITECIIDLLTATELDVIPHNFFHQSKRALVGSIRCAIAGSDAEMGRISIDFALSFGSEAEASVIGRANNTASPFAAYIDRRSSVHDKM